MQHEHPPTLHYDYPVYNDDDGDDKDDDAHQLPACDARVQFEAMLCLQSTSRCVWSTYAVNAPMFINFIVYNNSYVYFIYVRDYLYLFLFWYILLGM